MKLRTFEASNITEALELVRNELGEEAIILSNEKLPNAKGIRVTAAIEEEGEIPVHQSSSAKQSSSHTTDSNIRHSIVREIDKILYQHGVPPYIMERIADDVRNSEYPNLKLALQNSLSKIFAFDSLNIHSKPLILVGATGVGKTITAAKIATESVLGKQPINLISSDTEKAGATLQLKAFSDILKQNFYVADNPDNLRKIISGSKSPTIIDCFGVNPYDVEEMLSLKKFIDSATSEPLLIMSAGMDVAEASEIARIFKAIGANKFIVTKINSARRFGSILAAAGSAGLSFAGFSENNKVSEKIERADANKLAQILLR